ncbi:mucin-binding protein [Nicoliella lavandulae]|uniref:LPXTG cell wall anchor domain-containing protein n=1 Tax=Nicoliella lavandulae TaxID=3082954 RepID=A0ABU8SLI3_9LACO
MFDKNKYRKTNDKKVLHKVKKQWVILGTAALTLLAVETAPQGLANHSFSQVEAKADTTSAASSGSSSNGSATDSASSNPTSASSTATSASESSSASTDSSATTSGSTSTSSSASTNSSATTSGSTLTSSSASNNVTSDTNADNTVSLSTGSSSTNTNTFSAAVVGVTDELSYRDGNDDAGKNGVSLTSSKPATSTSFTYSTSSLQSSGSSYSFSNTVTENNSGVYHGDITINVGSTTDLNGKKYSYTNAFTYTNDSNNNSPLASDVVSHISNLTTYHKDANNSIVSSYTVSSADVSSYVQFLSSTSDTNLMNKYYINGTSGPTFNSSTSVLLFTLPASLLSNNYRGGDQIDWSFDLSSAENDKYSLTSAEPSVHSSDFTYSQFNNPVTIKFVDSNNNPISGAEDQYLTSDAIYRNDSFSVSVPTPSGYVTSGYEDNYSTNVSSSNNSFVVSGNFQINLSNTQGVTLVYKKTTTDSVVDTFNFTDNGNSVATTSQSGQPSSAVDVNSLQSEIPSGYALTSEAASSLSNLKFGSSDTTYSLALVHKTQSFTANDNSTQSGVTKDDLQKTFTRTINFVDASNQSAVADPVVQTVTYDRTGTYDEITNSVTYSEWSAAGSTEFASGSAPAVSGYSGATPSSYSAVSVPYSYSPTASSLTISYNKVANSYSIYSAKSTKLPSGLSKSDLTKSVDQTVTIKNGSNVVKSFTVPVTLNRAALYKNDSLVGYVNVNTTSANDDTSYDNDNWSADLTSVNQDDLMNRMLDSDYSLGSDFDYGSLLQQIFAQATASANNTNKSTNGGQSSDNNKTTNDIVVQVQKKSVTPSGNSFFGYYPTSVVSTTTSQVNDTPVTPSFYSAKSSVASSAASESSANSSAASSSASSSSTASSSSSQSSATSSEAKPVTSSGNSASPRASSSRHHFHKPAGHKHHQGNDEFYHSNRHMTKQRHKKGSSIYRSHNHFAKKNDKNYSTKVLAAKEKFAREQRSIAASKAAKRRAKAFAGTGKHTHASAPMATKHHAKSIKTNSTKVNAAKSHVTKANAVSHKSSSANTVKHEYNNRAANDDRKAKLPQTGENQTVRNASLFGLVAIAVSGIFAGMYYKKRN